MNEAATILVEQSNAIARLTLNRPAKLNAFTNSMHQELRAALRTLEGAGTRCLIVTGAGRAFCAGQDLSERTVGKDAPPPDLGASLERNYNPLVRTLRTLPFPVIAAVNGIAAGAGATLALACDIVIAAQSSSFAFTFAKLGLIPDSGGTWILPRLVGPARATALAMLGETITAQQAADWGLIWKAVPDLEFSQDVDALAMHFAKQPTKGLALLKRALLASQANTLDAQLDLERDLQRLAGRTSDYAEGVAAFTQKRLPEFEGK